MLFIKYVCRVPLRMSEEDMLIGDAAIHGEGAYCFFEDMAGPTPPGDEDVLEGQKILGQDPELGIEGRGILNQHHPNGEEIKRISTEQPKMD